MARFLDACILIVLHLYNVVFTYRIISAANLRDILHTFFVFINISKDKVS